MSSDEQSKQTDHQPQLAADLAALSARVETLEHQLALLRSLQQSQSSLQQSEYHTAQPAAPAAPPPPPPLPFSTASRPSLPPPPIAIPKPTASLEDRIGSQLFSRIGIVALLVAVTLFLKWAIDNHWIGPLGRILAGLIAGAAVVVWSERFRRKGFSAFSYALKAVGSGALYLSLWAAFQLYHLLPATVALGAMILVTAWNAFMSWSQNSELLAAYALAGAFATPLLLATGGNHEIFLFTYILVIDLATVALVRLRPWPRLLLGAFPATAAFFFGWYIQWYGYASPLASTTVFLALFFATFVVPSIGLSIDRDETKTSSSILEIFLPLANATFVALALYSVFEDAEHHSLLPWLAVLLAAVYLGLMRLPQRRVTSAVHLALAVVFLTIAIPLKASGRWITIGWLAEGVALLWASSRLSTADQDKTAVSAHNILRRLAILALALGFCGLLVQPFWLFYRAETPFLNSRFLTSLFGVAALAASASIALHAHHKSHEDAASPGWLTIVAGSIIALNLTAILGCVRELDSTWRYSSGDPEASLRKSLAISAFLMLYGAGLLAVGFWKRSAFLRWQAIILLVFTIGKTFLYDTRDLSQGYRVLSFLCLGVLLMAISFAYQKNWLALRDSPPNSHPEPPAAGEASRGDAQ